MKTSFAVNTHDPDDGSGTEVIVDVVIDPLKLAELCREAVKNRTQRTERLNGLIVAEVRTGSRRRIPPRCSRNRECVLFEGHDSECELQEYD
jgi:hypothetical protein